jgi:vacuolar-type H+-ATPase subunit E/Vma4
MEIVKNGELLEAQVLEDARAKAGRLREAADKESAAIRADGDARLRDETRRLDEHREAELATLRRELEASLPLDFRRTRLAFLQESLDTALAAYFGGLSAAAVGRIIGAQVARAATAFADRRVAVRTAGIDPEQARSIVKGALPGVVVETVAEMPADDVAAAIRGLIIECSDGSRRLRATIGELTEQLMEERREELITAFYGKDVNT